MVDLESSTSSRSELEVLENVVINLKRKHKRAESNQSKEEAITASKPVDKSKKKKKVVEQSNMDLRGRKKRS